MFDKLKNLPSIVWVFIFVVGLVLGIGSIITIFILIGTVPGVASAIFLVIGFLYVTTPEYPSANKSDESIVQAIAVGFFALMGMAIDQTGNFIYNYPFRYLCPPNTQLERSTLVSHPLPGRTDLTQNFQCYDKNGNAVDDISLGYIIAGRFIEYLIIAYLFIGIKKLKNSKKNNSLALISK